MAPGIGDVFIDSYKCIPTTFSGLLLAINLKEVLYFWNNKKMESSCAEFRIHGVGSVFYMYTYDDGGVQLHCKA